MIRTKQTDKRIVTGFRFPIKHSDWKYIFHEQFFTTHNMCLWKPPQSVQYWRRRTSIWQDSRQNLTRNIFPTTTNNWKRKKPLAKSSQASFAKLLPVWTFLIWTVKKTDMTECVSCRETFSSFLRWTLACPNFSHLNCEEDKYQEVMAECFSCKGVITSSYLFTVEGKHKMQSWKI